MLRRVRRFLLLVAVAVVEAILLLFFWATVCAWVGELEFPSLDHAANVLSESVPDSVSLALFIYGLPVGVALASVAFVAPFSPPIRVRASGRPLRTSVIAASFIGAGLAFGALAALLEVALVLRGGQPLSERFHGEFEFLTAFALVIAVGWTLWTIALWKYSRRGVRTAASRLLSLIFRGTLIELAIAIPAYAYVRRREDCYCGLGTFWALACGLGGLLFTAGPGALLLWYRRTGAWIDASPTCCAQCGYRRVEGSGSRCPECGAEWSAPR